MGPESESVKTRFPTRAPRLNGRLRAPAHPRHHTPQGHRTTMIGGRPVVGTSAVHTRSAHRARGVRRTHSGARAGPPLTTPVRHLPCPAVVCGCCTAFSRVPPPPPSSFLLSLVSASAVAASRAAPRGGRCHPRCLERPVGGSGSNEGADDASGNTASALRRVCLGEGVRQQRRGCVRGGAGGRDGCGHGRRRPPGRPPPPRLQT